MGYIRIPLETNPSTLAQTVFDYITTRAPGWIPAEGNLDVWIIRAITQLAAENRDLATDVQDDIFRYFGASLVGLAPVDATAAQGNTTWTLMDSVGHTISAGTNVGIPDLNGNIMPFYVVNDVVVPNGSTATSSGGVLIRALQAGADSNALGSAGSTVQLIDVIDWVSAITLSGATAGGADAEDDPTYLNRLTQHMQRLSMRPILPADFATMALDADPAVQRAVAIDGYNTADSSFGNQRMVTIAAVDANGAGASTAVKNNIQSYLQANREVNFVVNVMNPNFTTINVVTTFHTLTGYDPTATASSVVAAIQGYLSPASWGEDPTVRESSVANTWIDTPKVYYNEVIALIANVVGVDRVVTLTLNGGTADITLTGPASLTQPGTVTATAV
jgi:uncharacterized phage protein gp47/JayE